MMTEILIGALLFLLAVGLIFLIKWFSGTKVFRIITKVVGFIFLIAILGVLFYAIGTWFIGYIS